MRKKKQEKPKKDELPGQVYAAFHNGGRDKWVDIKWDVEEFEDGCEIGVYKLVSVHTKRITHKLEKGRMIDGTAQ